MAALTHNVLKLVRKSGLGTVQSFLVGGYAIVDSGHRSWGFSFSMLWFPNSRMPNACSDRIRAWFLAKEGVLRQPCRLLPGDM